MQIKQAQPSKDRQSEYIYHFQARSIGRILAAIEIGPPPTLPPPQYTTFDYGEVADVTTGLPQGSPVSLALFAIYVAEIRRAVGKRWSEAEASLSWSKAIISTPWSESSSVAQPTAFGRPEKMRFASKRHRPKPSKHWLQKSHEKILVSLGL